MKLRSLSCLRTLIRAFTSVVVALALVEPQAYAVKEYYSVARSPRALGMGNAFYSLSDDEYAIFYNPAGLSRYAGSTEFMLQTRFDLATKIPSAMSTLGKSSGKSISSIIQSLEEFQGSPLYGGVGISFPFFAKKNFALSLQLADAKLDFAVLGRDINTVVDLSVLSDSGLIVGYGRQLFTPGLHLGINAKGLVRAGGTQSFTVLDIAQGKKIEVDPQKIGGVGAGIDFDLGAMYELPKLFPVGKYTTSLVLSNLLGSSMNMVKIAGDSPPGLTRMVTLGAAAEFPGYGAIDKVNVMLDLAEFQIGGEDDPRFGARTGSVWKHVNLGVEVPIRNIVFLRTGLRQGYWTAGVGFDLRFMKIDFATYAEELAELPGRLPSRRVALRLAIGYGGSRSATVPSATSSKAVDPAAPVAPVPEAVMPPESQEVVPPVAPKEEEMPPVPTLEPVAPPAKPVIEPVSPPVKQSPAKVKTSSRTRPSRAAAKRVPASQGRDRFGLD